MSSNSNDNRPIDPPRFVPSRPLPPNVTATSNWVNPPDWVAQSIFAPQVQNNPDLARLVTLAPFEPQPVDRFEPIPLGRFASVASTPSPIRYAPSAPVFSTNYVSPSSSSSPSSVSSATSPSSSSPLSLSLPFSERVVTPLQMAVAAVSDEAGTCICKLANGKNCGRTSKPGSLYCGIHKNGCKNGYTSYARRLGFDQQAIAAGGFAAKPSPRVQLVVRDAPVVRQQCDDAKESPYELPITQRLLHKRTSPQRISPPAPVRRIVQATPSPVEPVVPLMQQLLQIPLAQVDSTNVMNQTCKCRVKVGHVCGRKVKPGSEYCGLHRNGCTYGYGKKSRRAKKAKKVNSQRKKGKFST